MEMMAMEKSATIVQIAVGKAAGTCEEWYRPDQPSLGEFQTRYAFIDPVLPLLSPNPPNGVVAVAEREIRDLEKRLSR